MIFFVEAGEEALLYEKVFLHPYYRHALLYHATHEKAVSFTLIFKGGVCRRIARAIADDPWLRGLRVTLKSAGEACGENGVPFFEAPCGGAFLRLRRGADFAVYRKAIARQIRIQAQTPVAKFVNKRISLPLSALVARTRIAPNHVTILALLWSVAGAACFLDPRWFLFAFACFQINSILDGTDGEIARMNFRCSAFGKKLDVYGDYLTSVLLIGGELTGYAAAYPYRAARLGSVLGLGALAAVGILWALAAWRRLTPENFDDVEGLCHARLKRPNTKAERLLAAALFVSRRDFYILTAFLLALAGAFSAAHFFLVLVCFCWLFLTLFTLKICAGPAAVSTNTDSPCPN